MLFGGVPNAGDVRLAVRNDQLADSIRGTKSSILKWMFGFWVGTALAVAASRLVL